MPGPVTPPRSLDAYRASRRLTGPLALDEDGRRLAVIHADGDGQHLALVDLWRPGEPGGAIRERTVRLGARSVAAVQIGTDGLVRVVADDADGPCLHIADWTAEHRRLAVPDHGEWFVRGEPLSPDGAFLAFGFDDPRSGARGLRVLRAGTWPDVTFEDAAEVRGGEVLMPVSWHPDGLRVACLSGGSGAPPRVAVVDLTGPRDLRVSLDVEHWTSADGSRWLPGPWIDERSLIALTDEESDVWTLRSLTRDGSSAEIRVQVEHPVEPPATAPALQGEVEAVAGTPERLWASVNHFGFSRLYAGSRSAGLKRLDLPEGVITRLICSRDGRRAALRLQTASAPPQIWLVEADGRAQAVLTSAISDESAPRTSARLRFVAGPEDRQVPVLVFGDTAPRGVLVSVHNGPEAQERPKMAHSGLYQYLAAHGLAIVAPNIGGSTGSGRREAARVLDDWGGRDLDDLLAVLDWAAEEYPGIPLGIYGVSYGGFLTLHALARRTGIRAAACVAAPCNLANFVDNVPQMFAERICAPTRSAASRASYLWSRSPMAIAEKVDTDLLLVQGDQDQWVPLDDAHTFAGRVRDAGGRARVRVVPGAGHHLGRNSRAELQGVATFLLDRLTSQSREPSP